MRGVDGSSSVDMNKDSSVSESESEEVMVEGGRRDDSEDDDVEDEFRVVDFFVRDGLRAFTVPVPCTAACAAV